MDAEGIDDKPQERESPVRHAHAVQASRHGRASTPGYLGLPAEEEPNGGADASASSTNQQRSAPRQGRGSAGRARARNASRSASRSGSSGERRGATARKSEQEGGTGKTRASREKPAQSKGRAAGGASAASKPQRSATQRSAKQSGAGRKTSARKASSKTGDGGREGSSARKPSRGGGGGGASRRSKKAGGSGRAQAAASSVLSKVASTGEAATDAAGNGVRREALRAGGSLLRHVLKRGWRRARRALVDAGGRGVERVLEGTHRLPIQRSIDVAVPPEVAWEQWLELEHLPEGPYRLTDVRRDGDELTATIGGARGGEWAAEVIDEREQESFAWRSTEGADSAGLVTFHPLGERLTRIELTVDVRPEDIGQAALLALHLADRRVEEELRRFKAAAELLNPDVYEELLGADGASESAEKETAQ